MSDKILLNGKEITAEELEKKRKEAEETKGMKLVELAPNEYRLKLED